MGVSAGDGVGGAGPGCPLAEEEAAAEAEERESWVPFRYCSWAPFLGAHAGQREAVPSARVCAGEGCWLGVVVMGLLAQGGGAVGLSGQGGGDRYLFCS